MPDLPIPTLIYGTLAIVGTFVAIERMFAGDFGAVFWPSLIVGFCVYRLATREEE